ncbi:MAG: orotidine-5'-phosphate decarboxylase [Desulfonatronovibrionaceae bacterium]
MTELVVALDFDREDRALAAAHSLRPSVRWFKVGLELFTAAGPGIVSRLKDMGCLVFLDLKFMDIPNTVYGAVKSACRLQVDMLTVHILGGTDMLASALRARNEYGQGPRIMGVTLLTSLDRASLAWPEVRSELEIVVDLADKGHGSGLDGLVCSGRELSHLSGRFPDNFEFVTPGIRLPGRNEASDQKRVYTPQQAARDGADYIVVGRPVTRASDPRAAARDFLQTITAANSGEGI